MSIERSILDAAARLRRNREPHLIATVVRVQGLAYRRPGARMLLTQFRWISGSVSGGSLEGDIASKAWRRTRDGEPVMVRYDSRMPHDGNDDDVRSAFGLGCDGVVEVMLERAGQPGRLDPLEFAEQCIKAQKRGAIATVIRSEVPGIKPGKRIGVMDGGEVSGDALDASLRAGMLADARVAIATGESSNRTYRSDLGNVDVFVEAILPPPRVFVFGTGHDAMPVVELVRSLGWDVAICAPEARVSVRQRFTKADELLIGTAEELAERVDQADRAIAIVMNHCYETDKKHIGALLGSNCRYIGVLGPRTRTARMLAELELGTHDDPRIHTAGGHELAAQTPQELALAIVADIQAALARAPAQKREHVQPMRERPMPRIAAAMAAVAPVEAIAALPTPAANELPTAVAS